jgi:alkylated DNA repair dioxygenase AlkB
VVLERRATRPHVTAVSQADLFKAATADELPPGFRYRPELIDRAEEQRLVAEFEKLEFAPFEFQGFLGKRRVISFGWRYDFNKGGLHKAGDIPDFLWPARERAAQFAGLKAGDLQHVLLTEYPPGSTIGWHKDRPQFDDVIGISLRSPCNFRFRRKEGAKWERRSFTAEPRSVYLLRGQVRTEWEHSIPPLDAQRYSITFRSLKERR